MISVTALILTHNENQNIIRTLAALSSIKRVIVIDSASDDETVEAIRRGRPDAQVIEREFDSHTQQWNFGLDQVFSEWVLTLDADYELSSELQAEIVLLDPPPNVIGYCTEFTYRIFGHSLRASSYPPRVTLFRTTQARHVDDGHTQTLRFYSESRELCPPAETNGIEELSGKIYHDDRKPLSHWIRSQDRYAQLEAKHLLAKPVSGLNFQDRLRRKIFFAAPAMFLYLLFARGLIFDGWPGWLYVAQRCIAELLLSIRLLIEREKLESGNADN